MGGVEDFSAQEAFVVLGELYVKYRREESKNEILAEQLEECREATELLRNELQETKNTI